MPTQPRRSDGQAVDVVAAADRTKGTPVIEQGFIGFPSSNAKSGESYALEIAQAEYEFEVPAGVTAEKGDILYMTSDNEITATATGNRAFALVTVDKDSNNIVWGILLPQA